SNTDNSYADFSRSNLGEANLSNAHFGEANLEGAVLSKADLRGANLKEANMKNVKFALGNRQPIVLMDDTTVLPDGTKYLPQEGLKQLDKFINPRHSEFWRSDKKSSPAYSQKWKIQQTTYK
ncbi:MAG: pentapeptide repeat-containing protein, partial [Chloroflexota bacterium]